MRRSISYSASVMLLALVLASCGGSGHRSRPPGKAGPATPPRLGRRFTDDGVSFRYPAAWRRRRDTFAATFQTPLVDLSPQPLRQTCPRRRNRLGQTIIDCRPAVAQLQPGSILASWSINSALGPPSTPAIASRLRFGGQPAQITTTTDNCQIGADRRIDVVIAIPHRRQPHAWYELIACLRGPGIAQETAVVRAMLASVRISG